MNARSTIDTTIRERQFANRVRKTICAAVLLLAAFAPQIAAAVTFTVDTTNDAVDANLGDAVCADGSGDCTLRAAVQEANDTAGADTILLPAGTYAQMISGAGEDAGATGDLDVTSDVTIEGAGTSVTVIDGGADRVLDVRPGGTLTLRDVTITGGNEQTAGTGGGIRSDGALTLERCEVSYNETIILGVDFSGFGGGIYATGALTITDSSIHGNAACAPTDGICEGGGLYSSAATTLTNTIVAYNGSSAGGGIYVAGGVLDLRNATIALNSGPFGAVGGGIYDGSGGSAQIDIRNSIVAANSATTANDCSATLDSEGYNLIGDTGGCTVTGDLTGVQSDVAPGFDFFAFGLNGGETSTLPLAAASTAVDAGNPATPGSGGTACTAADQRGYARGFGPCDLGAFELLLCPAAPSTPGTCKEPVGSGKASLQLAHTAGDDDKDKLKWKWTHGEDTTDDELGSGADDYVICVYDDARLVLQALVPGGGTCGNKPCWSDKSTGVGYGNPVATPDGVTKLKGKAGASGAASLQVRGKGQALEFTTPPWPGTVRVETTRIGGTNPCWTASFSTPTKNLSTQYRARSD